MQIIEKTPGKKPEWALDGTTLTIGKTSYDLQDAQSDVRQIIDVRDSSGKRYLATIIIPPHELAEEVRTGENGEEYTAMTPAPLDMDTVTLELYGRTT